MQTLSLETCTVDLVRRVVRTAQGDVRMSPKEASLLAYLGQRPGVTVSREELLREVWGYRDGVQSRTLDTTVRTLRAKVEADRTTPSHVLTDPGGGYRFEPLRPRAAAAPTPAGPAIALSEPNRFIGRLGDLAALAARFASGDRLITLVGVAGAGKSRLARRFARECLHQGRFPGGVRVAELTDAESAEDVVRAVAGALHRDVTGRMTPGQVATTLRQLGPVLLVLDQADGVVAPAARLVADWLDGAPETAFLVTSRERLRLSAEFCQRVDPLSYAESVELLRDRALAGGLHLDADGAAVLDELARRLEGIPLCLELAAARVYALGPRGVLERLSAGFSFLSDESRDAPLRHTNLHRAIEESWELLPTWARDAWMQSAAFAGGFDLQAARAVIDLSRYAQAPAIEQALMLLADRCLIRRTASSELRFDMFESLRSFVRKRLSLSERAVPVHLRHAAWFLRWGEAATGLDDPSAPGAAGLDIPVHPAFRAERSNLLAAYATLLQHGQGEDIARMARLLTTGALYLPFAQRLEIAEAARAHLDRMPPAWQARTLLLLGALHTVGGQPRDARRDLDDALARAGDDPLLLADLHTRMADLAREERRSADAHAHAHAASQLVDEVRHPQRAAAILRALATNTLTGTHVADVEELGARALALDRRAGWVDGQAATQVWLGSHYLLTGRDAEARTCLHEALRATTMDLPVTHATALLAHAVHARMAGAFGEAERQLRRALEIAAELGHRQLHWRAALHLGRLHVLLKQPDAALRAALDGLTVVGPLGPGWHAGLLGHLRGVAEALDGKLTEATASFLDAERLLLEAGDRRSASHTAAADAVVLVALKRHERARLALRRVAATGPDEERMLRLLGAWLDARASDRPAEGRRAYERALDELRQGAPWSARAHLDAAPQLLYRLLRGVGAER